MPLAGARLADGSGLDRADKVSAGLLAGLLALAAGPDHPELRPVLTGLPVAGFSGTLGDRYTATSPATGLIRAKTGTLTGVNSLAGTAVDAQGGSWPSRSWPRGPRPRPRRRHRWTPWPPPSPKAPGERLTPHHGATTSRTVDA